MSLLSPWTRRQLERLPRPALLAVFVIAALVLFRLWFITRIELLPDEAYYFLWSRHLDASYYSKGPGIAWTIALGTQIFGANVFGIRWLTVMLAAGTGWQIFLLTRRLEKSDGAALAAVLVAGIIPLFAIGSVLMTIDPLSVFFWVVAANLFLSARERKTPGWWVLTGLAVGLGFLAKFVNAFELLSFLFFALWSGDFRRATAAVSGTWRGWATILIAFLVCTTPVLWWNQHHGWITMRHLGERGKLDHVLQIGHVIEFLQNQALVFSPLLFILILAAVVRTVLRRAPSVAERYGLCLFAPVFVFYTILSLKDAGEANWTATAFIGAILLLVHEWRLLLAARPKLGWILGVACYLALIQSVLLHETAPLHLPANKDPLDRTRGWDVLAARFQEAREKYQPQLIIGSRYQHAAVLSWYLPGRPTTFVPAMAPGHIANQFSFWPSYEIQRGTRALFLCEADDGWPVQLYGGQGLEPQFYVIEKVDSFEVRFNDRPLRKYEIYLAERPRLPGT